MAKLSRRALVLLVLVAVLAVVFSVPSTQAATLTSGTFTYVVNGEETVFPFDPIVKKDGYLLPIDVFTSLGIQVDNPQAHSFTLSRGDVKAVVTLGQPWVTMQDGSVLQVAPAPMRVSGRVFLPTQLLAEMSVDVQTDSSIITLRDLGSALEGLGYPTPDAYNAAKTALTLTGLIKGQEGNYLNVELTYLTPGLAASPSLVADAGTRARLVSLLDTNTLVLVHLHNTLGGSRGLTFVPNSLSIIDNKGVQYDFTGTIIDIQGSITTKVGPQVDKYGIMVFPKLNPGVQSISYYADSNPGLISMLTLPTSSQ